MKASRSRDERGWREAGRRLATPLDRYNSVLVVSGDVESASAVARGLAEALSGYREVVITDLTGDLSLVRELADPSAEGVSDSFAFGVSLGRVAQKSSVLANVRVIPSGIGRVEDEQIFRSGRWRRFAEQCRDEGRLLVLVARHDAPALEVLATSVDGVLVVGEQPSATPGYRVLYRVSEPVTDAWGPRSGERSRLIVAAAAVIIVSAAAAGLLALRSSRAAARSVEEAAVVAPNPAPPPPPAFVAPVPGNLADSAEATPYSVELLSANTVDGANFELRRHRASLPAATLVPVAVGAERATWYRIVVGAFADARQADSLLRVVRARRIVADSAGRLVVAPFALLVDSVAAGGPLVSVLEQHRARGIPAYALMQPDGRALVYAGAFTRPEESEILITQLREAGLQPTLMYRTGRSL